MEAKKAKDEEKPGKKTHALPLGAAKVSEKKEPAGRQGKIRLLPTQAKQQKLSGPQRA